MNQKKDSENDPFPSQYKKNYIRLQAALEIQNRIFSHWLSALILFGLSFILLYVQGDIPSIVFIPTKYAAPLIVFSVFIGCWWLNNIHTKKIDWILYLYSTQEKMPYLRHIKSPRSHSLTKSIKSIMKKFRFW